MAFDYKTGLAIGSRGTSQGVSTPKSGNDLVKKIRAGGGLNWTTKKK
jgi:hypothetical protein